jgi:SAM-dependent methyltransferase
MKCRNCSASLIHNFLDLGHAPPSNAYLDEADLSRPEVYYPLRVKVCDQCWLVQTEDYTKASELFSADYAYFSSTSSIWLEHAALYTRQIIELLNLSKESFVIEIASNDGYLLKNFVYAGIPCLGIEPTESTARVAISSGIPVLCEFFGETIGKQLAKQGKQADLIIGNNVYAHVPNIHDFTRGLKALLKPTGTITIEFPHLLQLIKDTQFDTVYHEHFSYLSLNVVNQIFEKVDLRIFNVEELKTHGGSLRIYACHAEDRRETESSVAAMLEREHKQGLQQLETFLQFQPRADKVKNDLITFLIEQQRLGKQVVAYGAAAKGNTLLNYAGVKPDLLQCIFDANGAKRQKFMPGSHIPIIDPEELRKMTPDFILILPWNIAEEVKVQVSQSISYNVKFIVAIPTIKEI